MPALYRCNQGHLWEDAFDVPSIVDGRICCPLCGQGSAPENASSLNQALDPTPREESRRSLLARRVASPGPKPPNPGVPGATVVRPGLANQPKQELLPEPSLDASQYETAAFACVGDAPVWPSTMLPVGAEPRLGGHDFEKRPRGEWPALPGYEILGELGRGGMGVVYKARQLGLNRIVALKMILSGSQADERERARFRTEAQAVARLQHPNIVQIFDVGEHQGNAFFSLEYVDGGSLAEHLRGQPMAVNEAVGLLQTLARAIHFAHEHGVIHRDLKPANVLLASVSGLSSVISKDKLPTAEQGTLASAPKVTDFGLAKTLDEEANNTCSGMVVGTPSYMAPEQASGQGNIGPGTDVYALGVMLYQLVTGRLPFTGDTPMDVLVKVIEDEPPSPTQFAPRLARDLETITLHCLEKDPRRRYLSAAELADDLARFAAHEPIQARPIGAMERFFRLLRRRPGMASLIAATCLVVVILLGGAGVYAHGQTRTRREVEAELQRAHAAFDRLDWADARGRLDTLRSRVLEDRALSRYADEIDALAARAEGHLAAHSLFQRFDRARNDALFHAILASADCDSQRETIREKVLAALELVGASGRSGPRDEPYFSAEAKGEVQRGCYELLLVLADVTAPAAAEPGGEGGAWQSPPTLDVLDTASRLGLQTHSYHLHRARYLTQAGDADAASKERKQALARPPATDLDHYLVGNEHYRQGNALAAETSFVKVLRIKPDHFWARYFLALCHVRSGQSAAARDALTSCLGQQKSVVWIYLLRGLVLGQMGEYHNAEADFDDAEKLLGSPPDSVAQYALYNNRAVTSLGQEKYDRARKDLLQAIKLAPDQYHAHFTLSQVYQKQKNRPEALASLTRGIDVARKAFARSELDSGTLMMLHRCRYRLHLERGDAQAALGELQSVIDLADLPPAERAKAHRDRGHLLYRSGQKKEALSAYDAALKETPLDAETLLWRAEVLLGLQQYAEAAAGFDRCLAAGGAAFGANDRGRIYRGRAIARAQIGQHQAALGDFTVALGLRPDAIGLRVQRGRTYLACQAWKLAAQDFDAVLHRDPAAAAAYQGRGLASLRLGNVLEAANDAENVARHAGRDAKLVYAAACLLAQAAGQVETGRGEAAARRRRERYQDRALALLGQSLELLPGGERRPFWHGVQREAALRPLWSRSAFTQLEKRYGEPGTPP